MWILTGATDDHHPGPRHIYHAPPVFDRDGRWLHALLYVSPYGARRGCHAAYLLTARVYVSPLRA
jgi:hypothetical protein